jgi:hypothetical protein
MRLPFGAHDALILVPFTPYATRSKKLKDRDDALRRYEEHHFGHSLKIVNSKLPKQGKRKM